MYLRQDSITVHYKNMNVHSFPDKKSQRTIYHHSELGIGNIFLATKYHIYRVARYTLSQNNTSRELSHLCQAILQLSRVGGREDDHVNLYLESFQRGTQV